MGEQADKNAVKNRMMQRLGTTDENFSKWFNEAMTNEEVLPKLQKLMANLDEDINKEMNDVQRELFEHAWKLFNKQSYQS